MFKGLFGKKREATGTQDPSPASKSSPAERGTPPSADMIRVYDKFGRELLMSKTDWRTNVLPGTIRSDWSDPDRLYGVVVSALNDGFFAEVVDAANRLTELEPASPRATCAYGISLLKVGRNEEAERVLASFIENHGEDGSVLTNLAKAYAERGDDDAAGRTLWRALEVDPNQDNGLGWFWALARERGGDVAGVEALRRVADLPASWRAQLWLARISLQSGKVGDAIDLYNLSLSKMAVPAPAEALMQISGDLGNAGRLAELLQLCVPWYVPEAHGLMVGNNLVRASVETGQLDQAKRILEQLYRLQRPDWQQTLSYWDTELARARISSESAAVPAPLEMALLTIDGPVWAGQTSPAHELFPDRSSGPTICFLGASAEGASDAREPTRQLSDGPGRASRGIPLYFSEQLYFRSDARTRTLVPWISNGGGFILSGQTWGDETAAEYVRRGAPECEWLITSHLRCAEMPWTIDIRLIRASDGACVEAASAHFDVQDSHEVIAIAARLPSWLAHHASLAVHEPSAPYASPMPIGLSDYLLRLEQLLALRCAAMDVKKDFIHGAREIIQGDIELCLREPESVNARIILAQSIACLGKIEPSILAEVAARVRLLQREKPLGRAAQEVIDAAIENSLGAATP
ncbi:MAG: tetratricopeptide repeat protein [Caulobacterales bacterium]